MKARNIINGTWGEVWLGGNKVAECYKCQAKRSYNKEKITIPGQMAEDTKITGWSGTGSLGLYKVNSRLIKSARKQKDGIDTRFTIITKLKDPDNGGTERIALLGVSFDDTTLADWEAGVVGKVEAPFTYTDDKELDVI